MSKRQNSVLIVACAAFAFAAGAAGPNGRAWAQTPTYKIVDKIAGPDGGGWDLSNVDPKTRRLYVSRPHGVMMIVLDAGEITEKFATGDGVHGILPIPGTNM